MRVFPSDGQAEIVRLGYWKGNWRMNWSEEGSKFPLTGRNVVLQQLQESIATLWDNNSIPRLLVYLSGVRGIGKTRLLQTLRQDLTDYPPAPNLFVISTSSTPRYNFSLEGLDPLMTADCQNEIENWLAEVYQQARVLLPKGNHPETFKEYEQMTVDNGEISLTQLEAQAYTLAKELTHHCAQEHCFVVLIHDDAPGQMFSWLARHFYKELLVGKDEFGQAQPFRVCSITVGYEPPNMPGGSLMRLTATQILEPLTYEETLQILELYNLPSEVSLKLAEITAGHPGALAEAIAQVELIGKNAQNYNQPAFKQISEAIVEQLLRHVPPALARVCRVIAPLRRFNADLLAAVLPKMLGAGEPYSQGGIGDYMQLGRKLNEQLEFIESRQAYFMHPTIRQILKLALYYADPQSESFVKVNQLADKYYSEWLPKSDFYSRFPMLVEAFYHKVVLIKRAEPSRELEALRRLVVEHLRYLNRIEYFGRFAQSLSDDQDMKDEFGQEVEIIRRTLRENLPPGPGRPAA